MRPLGRHYGSGRAHAGVAKPTLYRRFPNRDALVAEIAGNVAESMAAHFRIIPGSADDLRQALIKFGSRFSTFLSGHEHKRYIHALGAAGRIAQSTREAIYRSGPLSARDQLAAWFAQLDQRNLLNCRNAEYSADQFLGMLMGMDLIRTLYHVAHSRDAKANARRVNLVVDDFLALHRVND
ncbi:MAG: TetR/AcrR family transcriptional regulator [Xanthomonadaceae bacterium]|nr:TetR/AcrR family transcriptional regulator [Xanthomonadaceae bacterium]